MPNRRKGRLTSRSCPNHQHPTIPSPGPTFQLSFTLKPSQMQAIPGVKPLTLGKYANRYCSFGDMENIRGGPKLPTDSSTASGTGIFCAGKREVGGSGCNVRVGRYACGEIIPLEVHRIALPLGGGVQCTSNVKVDWWIYLWSFGPETIGSASHHP